MNDYVGKWILFNVAGKSIFGTHILQCIGQGYGHYIFDQPINKSTNVCFDYEIVAVFAFKPKLITLASL